MNVYVRQALAEDANLFTKWYVSTSSFDPEVFHFTETYTLCGFSKGKILGFMVIRYDDQIQLLHRLVVNPEASSLEQALVSKELLKQVITLGYLRDLREIYFLGDHSGTNKIASHVFTPIEFKHQTIFKEDRYPIYRLRLGELE